MDQKLWPCPRDGNPCYHADCDAGRTCAAALLDDEDTELSAEAGMSSLLDDLGINPDVLSGRLETEQHDG